MKNKFAAVAAALTMAIGSIAMPATAEAGDRHERQWRQQQQQPHHNHQRQRQRDRGNDVGAVLGGMALGIILGEVINNGRGVPPVIINPQQGGGYYNGGIGGGRGYEGHRERCHNMQEQLNRSAYNMAYDGIDSREMRQIDSQMQRMRNNGCRPYRPF